MLVVIKKALRGSCDLSVPNATCGRACSLTECSGQKHGFNKVFFPTAAQHTVSNRRYHATKSIFETKVYSMIESPYFFVLLLFVVGYGWHSLLVRFKKEE